MAKNLNNFQKEKRKKLRRTANNKTQTESKNRPGENLHLEQAFETPQNAHPQDILSAQQRYGNQTVLRHVAANPCRDDEIVNGNRELRPDLAEEIRRLSHSGEPLPAVTRSQMSAKFGRDMSDVQIHTGHTADRISRQLKARAFTIGNHIFFRRGAFSPDTAKGRYTLSHELAHVLQQGGESNLNLPLKLGKPTDSYEKQAHKAATHPDGAANLTTSASIPPPTGAIQRDISDLISLWEERTQVPHKPKNLLRSDKPVIENPLPIKPPFQQTIFKNLPAKGNKEPDDYKLKVEEQTVKPQNLLGLDSPLIEKPLPSKSTFQTSIYKNQTAKQSTDSDEPQFKFEGKKTTKPKISKTGGDSKPTVRKRSLSSPPKVTPPKAKITDAPAKKNGSPQYKDVEMASGTKGLIGFSQFGKGLFPGQAGLSLGLGLTASGLGIASKATGLEALQAKERGDTDTEKQMGGTSLGLGIAGSSVSLVDKSLGFAKGLKDWFGARGSKKYRSSKAGRQIAKQKESAAGLAMFTSGLGFVKSGTSLAKGITKASGGSKQVQSGLGIAGGTFGVAGGLIGGGKSAYDLYGSIIGGAKAQKYTSSKDANIRKIAMAHTHQQTAKSAEAGLGVFKGIGDITGGIGGILSSAGLKAAGGITGLVGSGISLLSGIGQKFAKGLGTKNVDNAAKGLAERIKGGHEEAQKYAKSLGVDLNKISKDDPNLTELIKMKMGG